HSSVYGPGRSLQFCLRLLDPVCHLHLAVHRRRGREVLSDLLMLAGTAGGRARSKGAGSGGGEHTEVGGERQRLMVVAFGRFGVAHIERRCNGTEAVKRYRFRASLLLSPG